MDEETYQKVLDNENAERLRTDGMKIVLTRGYIRGIYHGVIGTLGFMLLGAMLLKALMI